LMPSSIGAAAVFASLLRDGVRRWREARGGGFRRRAPAAATLAVLALPNLVLAAPLLIGKTILWKVIADKTREQVCQAPLEGPSPIRVVVVWGEDPAAAELGGGVRWCYCLGNVVSWTVLSMSPAAQNLVRTSPTELTLKTLNEPLIGSEWEITFRSRDRPMKVGDTIRQDGGLTVTVAAIRDGRPTEVLFRFPRPIEASEYRLLVWRGGRLTALPLPAVGGSVRLGRILSTRGPGQYSKI
jgi:hypothetical protein